MHRAQKINSRWNEGLNVQSKTVLGAQSSFVACDSGLDEAEGTIWVSFQCLTSMSLAVLPDTVPMVTNGVVTAAVCCITAGCNQFNCEGGSVTLGDRCCGS